MNLEQFRGTTSGRVIKSGQGDAAYYASIPNPLPPQLPFDAELVRTLSDADRALGELAGLARMLPNPQLLIDPFLRREAVLSSRIEGTQADIKDVYAYEAQLPLLDSGSKSLDSDVHEVSNYVHALRYGLKRIETLPVSLRLIRELHEKLLKGVRGEYSTPGEFRHTQNWIGPPGCTLNEASYVPPPVQFMEQALGDLEKYLHGDDTYPPLIRLALIHYQFEAIHPFIDGNGRIGRLLISLLFVVWKLLPLSFLYLSAWFEQRRQDYYDLLLRVSQTGAWREWVVFFLRGVVQQAGDACARARQLEDLRSGWRRSLMSKPGSVQPLKLMEHLFQTPILTVRSAENILGVTYVTAQKHVKRLVDEQILRPAGNTPSGRLYIAGKILQVAESE
jgi:Fic family protein